MDIYKYVKITIGTVMRNPEILKLVPDDLKTEKMSTHAAKTLPFVIQDVPDQYKTNQTCDKTILEMVER